jgi:hypothetical protein
MASLYKKVISGKPYWYLREMGWVDGRPKMVSERYVGTAADIEALLDAREQAMLPERTRHLDFGAVAAVWGLLADLGVAAIIDEQAGARPPGLPLSPGTYLALAALNRVVDPCSKRAFAPRRRTGSPRSRSRRWITAGSGTRCMRCRWRRCRGSRSNWRPRRAPGSGWIPARWRWT